MLAKKQKQPKVDHFIDNSFNQSMTGDIVIGPIDSGLIDTIDLGTVTIDDWNQFHNYCTITAGSNYDANVNINDDGISMNSSADIIIGDRSLKEFIDSVEDRLAILRPNEALEERWDQLKELRRQYQELEQEILEKEKIMKILKDEQ